MSGPFTKFMVTTDIGRDRELRRIFTIPERWAWVAGVLCIASDAPVRGCFVIVDELGTAKDLKDEAGVSLAVAKSALAKFRKLEMLIPHPEIDCEFVRNWSKYNPEPKKDPTGAKRQADLRERRSNGKSNGLSNGVVTPLRHAERAA